MTRKLGTIPGTPQNLQVFVEDAPAVGTVEAECREGRRSAAGAHTDLEAAARERIQYRGVFRDTNRLLEREGDDAGREPDALGQRCNVGEEHQRGWQASLGAIEV